MSAPAFTPGPWFVHDFREVSSEPTVRDITVSCDHPATITVCSMDRALTAEPEEALANARLIAAAPELLEALDIIIANAVLAPDPTMGGTTDCYTVPLVDIETAQAALAKARGQ